MTAPRRIGIVGCGNIADNHVAAYRSIDGVEVVAVCDVDVERARDFAVERGIAHATGSVTDLVALGLDALSVCTPHPTHEAVVVEAASAGVHVLCEKPIATSAAAARRMIDAAESNGVTLAVVFQRRFWPGSRRVRAAIEDGTLGTPMLGDCRVLLHRGRDYYDSAPWRGTWAADGGGVLMTQAIHYIDLLQWFLGEPVEVYGSAGAFVLSDAIEVEDTAAAVITFASGAVATLSATVAASPNLGSEITVTGTSGATVSIGEYPEGSDADIELWAVPGEERAHSELASGGFRPDKSVAEVNASLGHLHRMQIEDFVAALREGREPAVTGAQALRSLQIVEAVYESARTGAPVPIETRDPVTAVLPHLGTVVEANA
ncbi:Gfo/Idh/MocA family oxidoreductase [Pseudoclavibacter chungangensis]|uniref:Gfo/Idh/MocA family oxidoreductase n=1 Tax=Pseudoclavibacter chungangensis TaxID=587635 RepID=A0A7J5BNU5_9MICO|nr:Gfo/Idh/MocA family oxidoreductase [Pseudoclavibacter chungangensis]KAB1654028.1 Gfo/Idh/MocA family oxidoreductase [Pseudoclavibacter chungangensis]NYJ66066.1 putative dehydrogenase [Pseudoclavibacter chungangensis]